MRVILSSTEALLNRLPVTIRELCSQFFHEESLDFDATIDINDIEELGFNFFYINEDEYELTLTTQDSMISINIEALNEKDFGGTKDEIAKSVFNYVIGNEFKDTALKLEKWYAEHNNFNNTFESVVEKVSQYYQAHFDDFEIICINGSSWVYDMLMIG